MRNTIAVLFVIFSLYSCSVSGYHVGAKQDDFDGVTTTWMDRNAINSDGVSNFCFNLVKHYHPNKSPVFRVWISLSLMDDWLLIEDGESLTLLVDGEKIDFYGNGSHRHRSTTALTDIYVNESAYYDITQGQLGKIANAKEVRVRVIGLNGIKEGRLTSQNISNVKRFFKEYILVKQ